jgi:hypothetical protein
MKRPDRTLKRSVRSSAQHLRLERWSGARQGFEKSKMNYYMPREDGPNSPKDITITDKPSKEQPEDLAPVRVFLLSDDETPTVALIEKRLRHVRQLYALLFFLRVPVIKDRDAIAVAALLLSTNENNDLEELVPLNLQIRAAGTGSFWVDLFLQVQSAVHHLPDMKTTADYLKNARDALTSVAAILALLGVKWPPSGKEPSDKQKIDAANHAFSDTMKRKDELKDVSEEDKQQIRSAVVHNIEGILGPRSKEFLQGLPPGSKTPRDT